MVAIILFIIFIFISAVVSGIRGSANNSRKRQDAVEEQRRRRAAYEAEHGKMVSSHQHSSGQAYHQEHPYSPSEGRHPQPTLVRKTPTASSLSSDDRISDNQVGRIPERYRNLADQLQPAGSSNLIADITDRSVTTSVTVSQCPLGIDELRRGIVMAEILGPCRAKSGPVWRR